MLVALHANFNVVHIVLGPSFTYISSYSMNVVWLLSTQDDSRVLHLEKMSFKRNKETNEANNTSHLVSTCLPCSCQGVGEQWSS